MIKNYGIILASGNGERFGSNLPKQFSILCGKTILEHSVEVFSNNDKIDEIIVVITPEYYENAKKILTSYVKVSKIIKGGKTRKESSFIGINSIDDKEANVLIHDCARPLLNQEILNKCIMSLGKYNAVTVGVPLTDTIVEVDNGIIKNIPRRSDFMNVQTPQCFKLSLIKKVHQLAKNDSNYTDDCSLIINYSSDKIYVILGDNENIKITYPKDLKIAEEILAKRENRS